MLSLMILRPVPGASSLWRQISKDERPLKIHKSGSGAQAARHSVINDVGPSLEHQAKFIHFAHSRNVDQSVCAELMETKIKLHSFAGEGRAAKVAALINVKMYTTACKSSKLMTLFSLHADLDLLSHW